MSCNPDNNQGFWSRVFHLYYDGFRSMTVGKTLWLIIAIKLFIFFVIIKLLFFPNFLNSGVFYPLLDLSGYKVTG